jgi:hypothetical protein
MVNVVSGCFGLVVWTGVDWGGLGWTAWTGWTGWTGLGGMETRTMTAAIALYRGADWW